VSGQCNTDSGAGVLGTTISNGIGVKGVALASGTGSAIFGDAGGSFTSWAGNFNGDVNGRDFFGNSFNPSDARLKKDVRDASYGLKEIMKLRPVTYEWKDSAKHGEGTQVGLIAQDVQKLIPELVKGRGRDEELALSYTGLVPVLVKAMQEQQITIARQEARLAALEKGHGVTTSSLVTGGAGVGLALLPFGIVAVRRRRKDDPSS